jgi:tetratricopeptide (TPR) repeat protein
MIIKPFFIKNARLLSLAFCCAIVFWACQNETPKSKDEFAATGIPEIDKITALLKNDVKNDSLWSLRGTAFYDAANDNEELYDFAIRDFQRAIQLDSNKYENYHALADAQLDFNQSQQAIKTLETVLKRSPDREFTLLKLSEFHLIVKQYGQAMACANIILEKNRNNSDANFMVGRVLKEQGDTLAALTAFQRSVQANSDNYDAYMQLGLLCAEQGSPLALLNYNNALRIDSTKTEALYAKAMYYQSEKKPQFEKALALYRKIVVLDPQNTDAIFNTGIIQLEQEKFAEAKTSFELSTKTDATCGKCFYYRAVIAEKQKDIPAARQFLEQALKLEPENESIKTALAGLK